MTTEMPDKARLYMAVVQDRQDHPFMKQRFHQVTWFASLHPKYGSPDFFALEFRDGNDATLVWMTLSARWAAGAWVKLAHSGADITCPPSQVNLVYLEAAKEFPTLNAAMEHLAATVPYNNSDQPTTLFGKLRRLFGR